MGIEPSKLDRQVLDGSSLAKMLRAVRAFCCEEALPNLSEMFYEDALLWQGTYLSSSAQRNKGKEVAHWVEKNSLPYCEYLSKYDL
jgi:REP element-mobilizing transposase RayT